MQQSNVINRPKAALFGDPALIQTVYAQGRREKVASLTDLYLDVVSKQTFESHAPRLRDLEVIFATWGMPSLTPPQLDLMPSLKMVFYAAGTVKEFACPFLERGIGIVSAWQANAIPVAEFTLSQILLSMKGFFRNELGFNSPENYRKAFVGRGNYGETVALLGAGAVGRKVIEFLKPFNLRVVVFDPFLSEANAAKLGVEKVSLEEAFSLGYVVSNHLANVPETRKMLHAKLFASMRQDATFINTGRGATVEEPGLIDVLKSRPDLTALLDVTYPEPPVQDSPFYTMPNVHLTSHIAGSKADETMRMADYCIEEFLAWQSGRPLRYAVAQETLARMA